MSIASYISMSCSFVYHKPIPWAISLVFFAPFSFGRKILIESIYFHFFVRRPTIAIYLNLSFTLKSAVKSRNLRVNISCFVYTVISLYNIRKTWEITLLWALIFHFLESKWCYLPISWLTVRIRQDNRKHFAEYLTYVRVLIMRAEIHGLEYRHTVVRCAVSFSLFLGAACSWWQTDQLPSRRN